MKESDILESIGIYNYVFSTTQIVLNNAGFFAGEDYVKNAQAWISRKLKNSERDYEVA